MVLAVLAAPVAMGAAVLVERRLGPSAAGWVAALPVGFSVAVVAVLPRGRRRRVAGRPARTGGSSPDPERVLPVSAAAEQGGAARVG